MITTINRFYAFVGADFEMAKQALTVNNFNLERAINYHLERSNSVGAPEDDVAGIDYKHLKTNPPSWIIQKSIPNSTKSKFNFFLFC